LLIGCPKCGFTKDKDPGKALEFCPHDGIYLVPLKTYSSRTQEKKTLNADLEGLEFVREWFPGNYEVRDGQLDFARSAHKCLNQGKTFLGSAPCGIGKSLAALLASLPLLESKKILICFRTRSQLHIYLKELKALKRRLSVVSFISKREMCPLKRISSLPYFDFLEACRRLKKNSESRTDPYCRYFRNLTSNMDKAKKAAIGCAMEILSPQKLVERMAKTGFCAYEALKTVLGEVNVFLGTYHYVFNPEIRENLLRSLGVDLSHTVVIVDEAHNLPGFSREQLSDRLTQTTIERASAEVEEFESEDSPIVKQYLEGLEDCILQPSLDRLKRGELKVLSPQSLSHIIEEELGCPGHEITEAILDYGEYVRDLREERGYDRIFSYTHRVGEFLTNFFEKRDRRYLHLIQRDKGDRIVLEVRNMDGRELTDPVLRESGGCVLMSGFLQPLDVYSDLCLYRGGDAVLREFESPFTRENRLIVVAEDVSSRLERRTGEEMGRWAEYVNAVLGVNQGNTAVFFTSYALLHALIPLIETDRDLIVEQRKTKRSRLVERLRRSDENVLLGVLGGKFSEGIDYPGRLLTGVVVVGFPYATWSPYQKALIKYFDEQFPGKGRLYAQACGRPIRSSTDRGCIVILDERVAQSKIRRCLPNYFQHEMKLVESPLECEEEIGRFWRS
jgi:DNA excision repair protein ERCC-2